MVTIPLAPVDAVRITILMDNVTDPLLFPTQGVERTTWFDQLARPRVASAVTDGLPDALIAQPGFSALVRVTTDGRERTILFDAGVTPTGVVENMRRLEIAPEDIETIVLSHGHWDHVAGMEGIAKELGPGNLPVLIHPRLLATSAHRHPGPRAGRAAGDQPLRARGHGLRHRRGATAVVPARRLGARDGRGRSHDTVRDRFQGSRGVRSRWLGTGPADSRRPGDRDACSPVAAS